MQPSKMQLERYFVEEASFRLLNQTLKDIKGEPRLIPDNLEIKVHLGEGKSNANKRFCKLSVKLKESRSESYPYEFKAVLVGFFELSADCSEKEIDILMTNTAPSMLYSAAREYLLVITGRCRFLPVLLPTIIFAPKRKITTQGSRSVSRKSRTAAQTAKRKATSKN